MKRLDSITDEMRGVVTYEQGALRVCLDRRAVQQYGLAFFYPDLQAMGFKIPTGRVAVFQRGQKIGTLPADFDPVTTQVRSFLFDIRPGDFTLTDEGWKACNTIGPGDFELIPGFEKEQR